MIEIKNCPICEGQLEPDVRMAVSKPFFPVHTEGVTFIGGAIVRYAHCPTCGAYVQAPRMTDDHIADYYAKGLYRKWLNIPQEMLDADEEKRARRDADLLTKLLGPIESHLDIGSSRGIFLALMGAETQVGIEPNEGYNLNEAATILPVFPDAQVDGVPKYELVSALHSLEHSTNPLVMLRNMANFSTKYIVIEVPSDQSPGGWARLAHTFHFPVETIMYMAEKLGLTVRTITHTPHTLVVLEKIWKAT